MKILRFEKSGMIGFGLLEGDRIIEIDLASVLPPGLRTIDGLIADGPESLDLLRTSLSARHRAASLNVSEVRLLCPISNPPHNIFCVGLNYREHVEESERLRDAAPSKIDHPYFFTKPSSTLNGPYDPIPLWAKVTSALDYEVELAVVIGRTGRDISRKDAMNHVFGYMIANDVSARDLQRRHGQWFKGKALDGSLPLGPWIVTADEVADPSRLTLRLTVNGELRQQAVVSDMIFDIPSLISELSAGLTLSAGDILLTGTPSGVGFAMSPPRFLKEDDVVECEISGLGRLRNHVMARAAA